MNLSQVTPTKLVLMLAAAGVIGGASATWMVGQHVHAAAAVPPAVVSAPLMPSPTATAPDFSQITAQRGPGVVHISVSGVKRGNAADEGDDNADDESQQQQDPFFEFFRRFAPPGARVPRAPGNNGGQVVRALGSGFIVSSDGLILTNAHVVKGAKEVNVKLTDRREFQAQVLGSDPKTDIAVLRIKAHDLPVVPLGSVRDLKVGEWVLAIGSPFGFENSVTAGVVSAKGRSLPDDSFVPFIQTDVAVNPGNSGGPLFNAKGEVVGINSQIFSRTGGYQGLSFAIPIDVAIQVKDQIVATGHASHAKLGVTIQEVNQALADSFKLDKPEGALVSSVEPGGAADKAGLKTGDVIRRFNGQPVVSSGDLPALVGQAQPGAKVTLEVWRQGKREEISAKLGNASDKGEQLASDEQAAGQPRLGLALRPLQPEERREAGVEGGLLVQNAGGAAARAGVQAGDVLVAVNGTPVKNIDQVRAAVAKSDKSVALLIQRDGAKLFVPVRLG
jgi:serine protease Do